MKSAARNILLFWLVLITAVLAIEASSSYRMKINRAVGWLSSHENDSSNWGAAGDVKLLSTSTTRLSGLTKLMTLLLAGNPVYSNVTTAVDAMSLPVMFLTAFFVMGAGVFSVSRKRKRAQISRCVLLALISLFLAQAAYASDATDPRSSGLDPKTAEKVQSIGRAVLATRHAQPESPAMEALRQRLADLRQAVMQVHGGVVRLEKEAEALGRGYQGSVIAEKERHIHAALEGLRRQRAAVELDIQESAEQRDHTVERNATAKVKELEGEVEDALQGPVESRAEKFLILQDRLAIKRLSPAQPGNETPTISTIVRHRGNQP